MTVTMTLTAVSQRIDMLSSPVSDTWTTLRVLEWTTERFAKAGLDSPRLEAQILLAHALSCERVQLYTSFDQPLAAEQLTAYRELIRQRLTGQPVAYLVGEQEFWSLPFHVGPSVLIPRRDTETVIEVILEQIDQGALDDARGEAGEAGEATIESGEAGEAGESGEAGELVYEPIELTGEPGEPGAEPTYEPVELVAEPDKPAGADAAHATDTAHEPGTSNTAGPAGPEIRPPAPAPAARRRRDARARALRIADIATGSGAIAVTLAHELAQATIVATDISPQAAAIARTNAARNQVSERVEIRIGDLLAPLAGEPPFDILVSNPPYVRSADCATLAAEVRAEPRLALDGGADGLVLLGRIIARAADHLCPGGLLVLEHGFDQAGEVAELIRATARFEPPAMRCDLGKNPRVTFARRAAVPAR